MRSSTARRPVKVPALALLVLLGACGTRVDTSQSQSGPSAGSIASRPTTVPDQAQATSLSSPAAAAPAAGQSGSVVGSALATPSVHSGSATTPTRSSGAAAPVAAAQNRPDAAAPGKTDPATAKPGVPAGPGPGAIPGPGAGTKSPVVIASVGTLSGPAGATIGTVTKGAQLWVAYINQRGGLNGHPVKYLVRDDGADPARHRALKQQSIEQDHAVAFLADAEGITGKSAVEYVQSKRVPVIGSEGGQEYFYKNPMFFPQASHGDSFAFPVAAAPAGVFVPQGKTKLGVLVCAEVELCGIVGGIVEKSAKALGFEIVYKGKASLAQPDFTAECLANRNAGAQVMVVIMDTNSLGRFASSCARQGFRPSFAELGSMQRLDQRQDANLVGMVASSNVFPYFQTGTPAADEFQAALKTQGSGLEPGIGLTQGWVAGKVLEKAAANLPEPPTSEAVLNGLWSFKDETLGGITAPLTFVKEQPAKRSTCWFTLQVSEKHEWVSPDGYKLNCQDLPYQP